jgi:flagellar biosynthesis regulator FlbT
MSINLYKEDENINTTNNLINNNTTNLTNTTIELVNIIEICKYLNKMTDNEKNKMFLKGINKLTNITKKNEIIKVLKQLNKKTYKMLIYIFLIRTRLPFKIYVQKSTVINYKDKTFYPKIFVSREEYYNYVYNTLLKFLLFEYPKVRMNFNGLLITHSKTCFIFNRKSK